MADPYVFRIKIDEEAAQFEQQAGKTKESLQTINIAVRNPNIHGLMLSEIPSLDEADVICSRLKRGEELMVPRYGFAHRTGRPAAPGG